jgi:sec-independent protein translocase protein TatA
MNSLFGLFNLGTQEVLILLVLGVLLFGRRLPEVGRYLGKGIVEFKKGMKGLEDEVEGTITRSPEGSQPAAALDQPRPPQRVSTSVPKFEDNAGAITAAPKFEDNAPMPPKAT